MDGIRKVVVNKCFGGFGLSYEAVMLYAKLKGIKLYAVERKRDGNGLRTDGWIPYNGGGKPFMVLYYDRPLTKKGELPRKGGLYPPDLQRDDAILVQVVEKLGEKANGEYAKLEITEVPDGVHWKIHDYDGMEHVEEEHRTW